MRHCAIRRAGNCGHTHPGANPLGLSRLKFVHTLDFSTQAQTEQFSLANAGVVRRITDSEPFGSESLSHQQPITQMGQDHQMTSWGEGKMSLMASSYSSAIPEIVLESVLESAHYRLERIRKSLIIKDNG
jgi:hypothetical protein